MFRNVSIAGIGSYNPKIRVDNEYYIRHFEQYGLEDHLEGLMNKIGREVRYLAEQDETTISMQVNATRAALDQAGLTPVDIDMIITASDTPEYLTPSTALLLKEEIGAVNTTGVFDINSDCIGMLIAMDVASRFLQTDKKYKRILVTGSVLMSRHARKDDMVTYPCIADGASAVILEVNEEEEKRGFIGSRMFTDSSYKDTIRFPACGLSNISKEAITDYDRKLQWNPFDFSFLSEKWYDLILQLLKDHGLAADDVAHYFMSQFSRHDIELTMQKLGTTMEKAIFIGDKYGYTGCASPVMAMFEYLKTRNDYNWVTEAAAAGEDLVNDVTRDLPGYNSGNKVNTPLYTGFKKDDLVIFCSVAAGYTMEALLYKF